jgi:hypothetical protein
MINIEHKVFCDNLDLASRETISKVVQSFESYDGGDGERNTIKNISTDNLDLNIKAFKIPHYINRTAYSFFRKSKANRSFEYAKKLLEIGINTPDPLAYFEYSCFYILNKSFFISCNLKYDLTFRELINNLDYPDHDIILREFTRFTFDLHEKGINFLDHSAGNTLIKKNNNTGKYDFYLVDLNRMKFHSMSFNDRMKNFAKLTSRKEMVRVMANEYSKLVKETEDIIFDKMWSFSLNQTKKYDKRVAFKKKIFFWK